MLIFPDYKKISCQKLKQNKRKYKRELIKKSLPKNRPPQMTP